MINRINKLNAVAQNVILGSITGIIVGFNLRTIYMYLGGLDIVWVSFFILGPAIGYLSGRERLRVERLKKEKAGLESDLNVTQGALQRMNTKYRILVEQANDAIFLTTEDGRFIYFNEATCNFAGYGKNELKKMRISQLRDSSAESNKLEDTWLDNGVYRYEEKWNNKDGNPVFLEINARWIRIGENRLILNVGRNIKRQKEIDRQQLIERSQAFHLMNLLQSNQQFCNVKRICFEPVESALTILERYQKNHPQESEGITAVRTGAEEARNSLEFLLKKAERDLDMAAVRYDINDILYQELVYFDMMIRSDQFRTRTAFSPNLPQVYGLGRDFSLGFNTIFMSLRATMSTASRKEMYVATRQIENNVMVEIMAGGENTFLEQVLYHLDPIFKNRPVDEKHVDLGRFLLRSLLNPLTVKFDSAYQEGKGTIIRIQLPISLPKEKSAMRVATSKTTEEALII